MGFVATIVLGIVGSFVGGFLYNLIFDGDLDLECVQLDRLDHRRRSSCC